MKNKSQYDISMESLAKQYIDVFLLDLRLRTSRSIKMSLTQSADYSIAQS